MAPSLRDAEPERGWDRLRFPPRWWELPALLAGVYLFHKFFGRDPHEALSSAAVVAVLFFAHYFEGERALLHRLDRRLGALQSEVERLSRELADARRMRG